PTRRLLGLRLRLKLWLPLGLAARLSLGLRRLLRSRSFLGARLFEATLGLWLRLVLGFTLARGGLPNTGLHLTRFFRSRRLRKGWRFPLPGQRRRLILPRIAP